MSMFKDNLATVQPDGTMRVECVVEAGCHLSLNTMDGELPGTLMIQEQGADGACLEGIVINRVMARSIAAYLLSFANGEIGG